MHLYIFLHSILEVTHHRLTLGGELQNEIWLQFGKVDVVIFRFFVRLFELDFDLLLDRCASSFKLLLLLVLFAEQIMSLEHEDHLLLRLLKKARQLDANLISKLVELRVLFLN